MASSNPQRLTTDGRAKMDPVFIRDGAEIIYTVEESATQFALMRLTLADGTVARFHPQATTTEFEATFSPDGRYYAFVQSRGNLSLKLVIRDTRQNKDAVFDPGGGFSGMRRPTIAADGRLAFSIPGSNGQQIHSIDLQGQDRKELTSTGFNSWPAYAPDGKSLAFGSSKEGHYDIYVMDAAGGNFRRLTTGPGLDMRPAWSPDGRRLSFTSNRDGTYEIYVMQADGRGVQRVTNHAERDDYSAWHPDGRRLVWVAERAGKFDLYMTEVPG